MGQKEHLIRCVADFLDSRGWNYQRHSNDSSVFMFGMSVDCKLSSVRMIVFVTDELIQSIAVAPIKAGEGVRANVAEFITRANFGKSIGKFELDYSDGEVRCQSCLLCSEGTPAVDDVERIITIPPALMTRYVDGLVKSLMGFGTPEANFKEIVG